MPRDQKRDNLFSIVGNVGKDPEIYGTDAGDVLKLSVATTLKYPSERGAEDGETRWVNVSVWKEDLQKLIMGPAFDDEDEEPTVGKGMKVAVIGFLKTDREYKGVKQYDLTATQIGLVEFLVPKRATKKSSKKTSTKKAAPVDDEDDDEEAEW